MRVHVTLAVHFLLIVLLMGAVSCETGELDESIDPVDSFFANFIRDGEKGVPINEAIAYNMGQQLDPNSVGASSVSVKKVSDSTEPQGNVSGTLLNTCAAFGVCPSGVGFAPDDGNQCDLTPNTAYQLVISGVRTADGATLPDITVDFTTGGIPAGYTPDYCDPSLAVNFVISGNTLTPTAGITGDLAGDTSADLDIVAQGVENQGGGVIVGQNYLGYPRYYPILTIENTSTTSDFNLGSTAGFINVRILGIDTTVVLPSDTIEASQTLALYIANDGTSYYAFNDTLFIDSNAHTHDYNAGGLCDDGGAILMLCPTLEPSVAFSSTYLAAPASATPSVVPMVIEGATVDASDGLNSGILPRPNSTLIFELVGINAETLEGRYEINNTTEYGYGYYHDPSFGFISYAVLNNSLYSVGHFEYYQHGPVYKPIKHTAINTPDSWLLMYIENLGASQYNGLSGGRTVTVTDGGSPTVVSLPGDTIPAGEALPLYITDDGRSFYAQPGPDRTLDLWAAGCGIGDTINCTLMDGDTALNKPQAAP